MKLSSFAPLGLLAVSALSLQAEAPRFGVQGHLSFPLGDLKDFAGSKPALGLGFHGTFHQGGGHMFRPRFEYTIYPEASFLGLRQNASNLSLGGDYLLFVAGRPLGFYLTGGLSAMRWYLNPELGPPNGVRVTTKLGLAAGVGYQLNTTTSFEMRYVQSSITSSFDADALQLGMTLRF